MVNFGLPGSSTRAIRKAGSATGQCAYRSGGCDLADAVISGIGK